MELLLNTTLVYQNIVLEMIKGVMYNTLLEIKSMLDKLEQPIEIDTEKYFETMNKIASEYFRKASEQAKEILKENNK